MLREVRLVSPVVCLAWVWSVRLKGEEAITVSTYPPGWYPDGVPGQQRYWDGACWTQYVIAAADQSPGGWRARHGQPRFRHSAQLVSATYRMLFETPSMIVVLLVGAVVASAVAAAIMVSAMYWGHVTPGWSGGGVLGVLVAGTSLGAATLVLQLVSGVVVAAAVIRAEGRPVSMREALLVTWARRKQLLAWALVSTLVGVAVRASERFGLGAVVAAWTLNLGWAFATVFATPVIVVEGTMPIATLRRSAGLLRSQFTVTLVSGVTLALPWIGLAVGSVIVGTVGTFMMIFASGMGLTMVGALLCALGVVGFFSFAAVSSALSAFLETILYRYAVGLPTPGIEQSWVPPLRPR